MIELRDEIANIYKRCGDRGILPFVGDAFGDIVPGEFRVGAVGFNCYVSEKDLPEPIGRMQPWFAGWWRNAGTGTSGTHRFYNDAFRELFKLSQFVVSTPLWRDLTCNLAPENKRALYATNAIKIYTSEDFKSSSAIPAEMIADFDSVWRSELDALARVGALPHLVVVFGRALWQSHWQALHPRFSGSKTFSVRSFTPAGDSKAASYHHANLVRLDCGGCTHTLLLACLHHPSARASRERRRDAAWLISQSQFRRLLEIPDSADAG